MGEPLAYIIGQQPFLNVNIDLFYRPLIPRPETEYWLLEYVFPEIEKFDKEKINVLDIFSGSGCLGLAAAKNFPRAKVVFADKYSRAILQIKRNIKMNNLQNAKVVKSDLFKNINETFDVILANPPYVRFSLRKDNVEPSVLFYEPFGALFSKNKGLNIIFKFLHDLPNYMHDKSLAFMEFSPEQRNDIEKFLNAVSLFEFEFLKDQYNKDRVVKIKLKNS